MTSKVEQVALQASGYELTYRPHEKLPVIVVDNFPNLGRLTALRFLEWVSANPEGVAALPTGKTPEYFIKYVMHYLSNWTRKETRAELEQHGLTLERKPSLAGLRFVQLDEFYPIDTRQHNSFHYYVNKFYIKGFGLDPARAMLIDPGRIGLPAGSSLNDLFPDMTVDLSLRIRKARTLLEKRQQRVLEEVDQFCTEYEHRVREMGGIGFFMGGIGPDGHIAFNIRGSDFYSTTRLIEPNYETRAAAATDLGGMEVARNKLVITIGLRTITYNKNAVAIIIAAGEAKADIVARTIHSQRRNEYPGSALAVLPNARFYLTRGAASRLTNRVFVDFAREEQVPAERTQRIVMDLSLNTGKPIQQLTREDFLNDRFAAELIKKTKSTYQALKDETHEAVLGNLKRGNQKIEDKTFLHTAPHHDDIILAYLPYVTNLVRRSSTRHAFAYMTSGFNAVTNDYMHGAISDLLYRLEHGEFDELLARGYFEPANASARRIDVSYYHEGAERRHEDKKLSAISRRILRNMFELYEEDNVENLKQRCHELLNYFSTQYPGKKDMALVQQLKGRVREFESELKWASYGFIGESVRHLRLGFYKGDMFTEVPRADRDIPPIRQLLEELSPDITTVAFDPEGSGPDTHYKVLQAVAEALKAYEKKTGKSDVKVIGYRNVWFKFHPAEANLFVPTSSTHLADMDSTFDTCFNTQRTASFPSYELDGPFSKLARKIQVKQFEQVKTFLGEDFFINNEDHGMRACRGIVYLREMTLPEFYSKSRELRQVAEAI
ncbi:MAG: glucosamine-6-phosphate deaminase [Phycisphaerales bacterium]|nr:glucosamine-6-phosphate deaminase [Phycisphaerales bacterium]